MTPVASRIACSSRPWSMRSCPCSAVQPPPVFAEPAASAPNADTRVDATMAANSLRNMSASVLERNLRRDGVRDNRPNGLLGEASVLLSYYCRPARGPYHGRRASVAAPWPMSVSRRILAPVALGVAFVVSVVTAVTYALVYEALKARGLEHLATYVSERAQREEARFQQVQSNLLLVRAQFLKRLEAPMPPGFLKKWDLYYRRYADGAWRSREQFADARTHASMWAHRDWRGTPERQREALVAQELCDEMLPGWVDVFPSFYFHFRGPLNVGVDLSVPTWPWDMPADFDGTGVEWVDLALPKEPPQPDRFSWTGVQVDPVTPKPLVDVYLPIVKDGVFLGSVGHNMPMEGMLQDATHSAFPGAAHAIFRADGRLIAHSTKRAEILAGKGLLRAQDSGDPALVSLYRIATARRERLFSGFDEASDSYYAVARLAGPEWFYVTTLSRDHLQSQAFASAQWVLWSGLLCLVLVLAFIATVVRNEVARPLAELTRATEALSAGAMEAPVPAGRAEELEALARSFRVMVENVAARQNDLRQLNQDLERRVADRTETLNRALALEREAGELKSRFVSLVSHEFRTPLGVIVSAVEVLQRYFERLSSEQRAR